MTPTGSTDAPLIGRRLSAGNRLAPAGEVEGNLEGRELAVGAMVVLVTREVVGKLLLLSYAMTQGPLSLTSQLVPDSLMVSGQQSSSPSVPGIEPQPGPPHTPSHVAAQQMVPLPSS